MKSGVPKQAKKNPLALVYNFQPRSDLISGVARISVRWGTLWGARGRNPIPPGGWRTFETLQKIVIKLRILAFSRNPQIKKQKKFKTAESIRRGRLNR